MEFYWFILGVLGTWRITHLFYGEDGPGEIFVKFRKFVGSGFWGNLLDCFYCLSVWVAFPLAIVIGGGWKERIFLWLAMSAGAILLERLTTTGTKQPPTWYFEEKENRS